MGKLMSEKKAIYLHKYDFEKGNEHYISKSFGKRKMPIIKCSCGTEILVVPDIKAMDRAISRHVAEHNEKAGNSTEKKLDNKKKADYLIRKLLKAVATINV
jgi:hypothetical protein